MMMLGWILAGIFGAGVAYFFTRDDRSPNTMRSPAPIPRSARAITIGDSQSLYISNASVAKVLGPPSVQTLWMGGKSLPWLVDAVSKFREDPSVTHVFISIGTNDGYKDPQRLIPELAVRLAKAFPNARLSVVQGSWGWGGVTNIAPSQVDDYYRKFTQLGITAVVPPIGDVVDPHGDLPIYKTIGQNINRIVNNEPNS